MAEFVLYAKSKYSPPPNAASTETTRAPKVRPGQDALPAQDRFLAAARNAVEKSGREFIGRAGANRQHTITCPAHDDNLPSLSVGYNADTRKVLLTCNAGCELTEVLAAVEFSSADLQDKPAPKVKPKVVATYEYARADGTLSYQVLRLEPKDFQLKHRVGKGWKWGLGGAELLPYKLPELIAALRDGEDVYVVEGEKDVEALLALGVAATCNSGGGGPRKWSALHSHYFAGTSSSVIVVADKDKTGYEHALGVVRSLGEVGVEAKLALPKGTAKDAFDHLQKYTLDELLAASVSNVEAHLATAMAKERAKKDATSPAGGEGARHVLIQRASDIVSQKQRFLWDKRIPMGTVSLFAGRGGVGKSTFAIWLAVQLQHGLLAGDFEGQEVSVLYVSVEDDWATQMKPRLMAAGANLDTFHKVSIGVSVDGATGERIPSLPQDTELLREAIEQTGANLVILDPITSTMQGDDHKRDVVRAVLDPLAKVAQETGAVILGIMHYNKGAGDTSDKMSGSHAYRDAARSALHFAKDDQSGSVVMSQDKGNYADFGDKSIEFQLIDREVLLEDGETAHVATVLMVGETSLSVNEIVNRKPPGEASAVVEWLTDFMEQQGGTVDSMAGLTEGQNNGFSVHQITRARRKCRPPVRSIKPKAMNVGWVWTTEPEEGEKTP